MIAPGSRYVALGSSFAAGPLLGRRAPGAPLLSGRSRSNYAHLVAHDLGLDLVDVTFSGATAREILDGGRRPPQVSAISVDTALVTVTCGGNDVGYIPGLAAASLPARSAAARARRDELASRERADVALDGIGDTLRELARDIRRRAPDAVIVFADYLTVLPPDASVAADPVPADAAELGRHVAARLAAITREAALAEGCRAVAASAASVEHHAWSSDPWTNGRRFSLKGAAFHPRLAGMRAVADLIIAELRRGVG
jgi:lysophospholipase L1-like esterase